MRQLGDLEVTDDDFHHLFCLGVLDVSVDEHDGLWWPHVLFNWKGMCWKLGARPDRAAALRAVELLLRGCIDGRIAALEQAPRVEGAIEPEGALRDQWHAAAEARALA